MKRRPLVTTALLLTSVALAGCSTSHSSVVVRSGTHTDFAPGMLHKGTVVKCVGGGTPISAKVQRGVVSAGAGRAGNGKSTSAELTITPNRDGSVSVRCS